MTEIVRQIVDCPALSCRWTDKGYPFGNRIPLAIRLTRTVRPDFPMNVGRSAVGSEGYIFPAWTNSYGAVAALMSDGKLLGVKPNEFVVVEWLELVDG